MTPAKQLLARARGFTLVELLVVIAVVGVLAALMLPSLRRAREVSKQVVCMSNQRQIAVGVIAYTGDFLHRIPPSYSINTGNDAINNGCLFVRPTPWHMGWRMYSASYPGPNVTSKGVAFRGGLTYPDYLRDPRVFYCPDNLYDSPNYPLRSPGLTAFTRFSGFDRGAGLALWEQMLGSFDTTYAFPGVRDDLAAQRFARGETGNGDYNNWYTVYVSALLDHRLEPNEAAGKPMLFDTSYGPYGVVNGATPITYYNHDLRVANVTYWDGRVLMYPHARYVYDNRIYGYGYRGFTDRTIVGILTRFGRGETEAK